MTDYLDLSSEQSRTYHYEGGAEFSVPEPKEIHVLDGSHRVISFNGRTYRPERGWLAISWLPKDGKPAFVA